MISGYSATMMIAPKEVVRMLTFVLLICSSRQGSSVRGASFFEQQQQQASATEFPYSQLYSELSLIEPIQRQQRLQAVDENLSQDNLKGSYLLKDLDLEGYSQRQQQPVDSWRLIRLSQLLDSLSSSIPIASTPTQSPIYRSGRTFPTLAPAPLSQAALAASLASNGELGAHRLRLASSGNGRFESADPQQQLLFVQPTERLQLEMLQQQQGLFEKDAKTRRPTVLGIAWPPTNKRRSQVTADGASRSGQQLHRIGTEEVAINTPMHPRLNSDSESKRVESNKNWNRLYALWGKRAAASGEPAHFNGGGNQANHAASTSSRAASLFEIQRELERTQRSQDAIDK